MVVSRGHSDHIAGHTHGTISNADDAITIVGAIAQLAEVIIAHAPCSAIFLNKQGVITARRHGDHVAGHTHGHAAVVGGAVAQLAVSIIPHGPQGAVGLDKQRVVDSGRQSHHVVGHQNGTGGIGDRPIA